jgi:hypothetical protein
MSVSQADVSFNAGGHTFAPGDFIVHTRGTQEDLGKLKALVEETGLTAYAVGGSVESVPLHLPKVGLLKPNASTMPEGWTRLRLDRAGFPYVSLSPTDISDNKLAGYKVMIIPSANPNGLINGSGGTRMPPEYRAGIGASGVANLKSFVENGGTLVLMGAASTLPMTQGWDIGVSQPAAQRIVCHGSILRIQVDPTTRIGYGYDKEESSWFLDGTPYFTVTPGSKARVVATYPTEGDLLQSGYISGGEALKGMAAIVDAPLGAGHVILLAPDVLYRAQSTGDFMFFWNALIEGSR